MENLWIPVSLLCAFSAATSDALTKKAMSDRNEYLIAWLRLLVSSSILLSMLFFIRIPVLDRVFYATFLIALPLEVTAFVLYMKALKLSPLSLTLPFLSLTPVFLIIVPAVVIGERVSVAGAIGVLLIALGGYTLNIRDTGKSFLAPFYAVKKERGSLYMIGVALIYSITAVLAKIVIQHSSPEFSAVLYNSAIFICITPMALMRGRKEDKRGALKASFLPGVFDAAAMLTNMIAINMAKLAYVISVKRLSLLLGVMYGYFLFREKGVRERFLGTALMLAGFMLIVLNS